MTLYSVGTFTASFAAIQALVLQLLPWGDPAHLLGLRNALLAEALPDRGVGTELRA